MDLFVFLTLNPLPYQANRWRFVTKGSDCLQVQDILAKDLVGDEWLTEEELRFLMSVTDEEQLQLIYKKAYEVKAKYVKPVAYYRGLIEFSNRCIKNCNYCGIRREND